MELKAFIEIILLLYIICSQLSTLHVTEMYARKNSHQGEWAMASMQSLSPLAGKQSFMIMRKKVRRKECEKECVIAGLTLYQPHGLDMLDLGWWLFFLSYFIHTMQSVSTRRQHASTVEVYVMHRTHWNTLLQHLENGGRPFQSHNNNNCICSTQPGSSLSLYTTHGCTRMDHCQLQM